MYCFKHIECEYYAEISVDANTNIDLHNLKVNVKDGIYTGHCDAFC